MDAIAKIQAQLDSHRACILLFQQQIDTLIRELSELEEIQRLKDELKKLGYKQERERFEKRNGDLWSRGTER